MNNGVARASELEARRAPITTLSVIGGDSNTLSIPVIELDFANDIYYPRISGNVRIQLSKSTRTLLLTYDAGREFRDKTTLFDSSRYQFMFSTIQIMGRALITIRESKCWIDMLTKNADGTVPHLTLQCFDQASFRVSGDFPGQCIERAIMSTTERSRIHFTGIPPNIRKAHITCESGSSIDGVNVLEHLDISVAHTGHAERIRVSASATVRMNCLHGYRTVAVVRDERLDPRRAEIVEDDDEEEEEEEEGDEEEDQDGEWRDRRRVSSQRQQQQQPHRAPVRPMVRRTAARTRRLGATSVPRVTTGIGGAPLLVIDSDDEEDLQFVREIISLTRMTPEEMASLISVARRPTGEEEEQEDEEESEEDDRWQGGMALDDRQLDEFTRASRTAYERSEELMADRQREERKRKLEENDEKTLEKRRKEAASSKEASPGKPAAATGISTACTICFDEFTDNRRGSFPACGHASMCYECAKNSYAVNKKCPICRKGGVPREIYL